MFKLAKTVLLILIIGGELSYNLCHNVENRVKARHKTKPGSLHRKARHPGSRDSRFSNADTYGKASDSYGSQPKNEEQNTSSDGDYKKMNLNLSSINSNTSESTTGDTVKNYEEDVISGNGNNTFDLQNSTSSSLGNSSSPYNSSQFNDSTVNFTSSNSYPNTTLNQTDAAPSSSLISELPQDALRKSGIFLGFLPDDGSSGGTRQTIAQLNSQIGKKSAVYGWYAQAHSGIPFDGSQLLAIIDDVKACKCVFQPAIMPVDGWQGLTSWDNSQAVAIAQVLKRFTDEGIPVWLRFAHEVNYYQKDGTYQGNAADFKAGWAAVSAAIKKIAPTVKMWWTPNVSTAEDYEAYEPDDMSTVDLVGIDYYPKQLKGNDFLDAMKEFHDKYAVDGRKFAIGETGLGWSGNVNDKTQWFKQICEAKSSLPEFVSMAWFNFDKEYDYKIAGEPTLNEGFTALV